MASAQIKVSISEQGWSEAAALMERLPIAVRGKELQSALRKGLGLVRTRARQLVPKPGYPGDKAGLKPLRDTIGLIMRKYQGGSVIAGVVGPEYPAGAHGHLVEHGHKIATGGTVPGYPYMNPAYQDVKPNIETLIINSLQLSIAKHGG